MSLSTGEFLSDRKFKELIIGLMGTLFVGVLSFLAYNFASSVVTKAEYTKDMNQVELLKKDIDYIKDKVDSIDRKLLKNH